MPLSTMLRVCFPQSSSPVNIAAELSGEELASKTLQDDGVEGAEDFGGEAGRAAQQAHQEAAEPGAERRQLWPMAQRTALTASPS